jgi:acetyl esterase/lipase
MSNALVAITVSWTALGLAAAVFIVAPGPTSSTWLLGVMTEGYSLAVTAVALIGVALAALTMVYGSTAFGVVTTVLALATLVLSLIPVIRALQCSARRQAPLSLKEHASRPAWMGRRTPETLTFARPDATPGGLRLDVLRPAAVDEPGPRPAVVMVHGGGWVSGGRGGLARWNEWLAALGYVVFDVDYRLAPPARFEDAPGDVASAVAWVQRHAGEYEVDPSRVALVGHSAGGHLALLVAYCGRNISAVVAFYPITDLTVSNDRHGLRWTAAEAERQIAAFIGYSSEPDEERRPDASPVSHVRRDVPPTLLLHGRRDQMVPVEQSRRLDAALTRVGAVHEYLELPGSNHAYDLAWGGWTTQITREVLRRFLERHVPATGSSGA